MIQEEELLKKAKEAGFDNCRILPAGELSFDHSLRKHCVLHYCGNYGNNYSCPPECGTPEEMEEKTRKFSRVLVLQTITPVHDIADDRETREIKHRHNQMTWGLIDGLSEKLENFLPAMAGPCQICKDCEKKDGKPCSFPERIASCLSAYCIQVDKLAEKCDMPYWCQGEVAFFSLLFFS